MRPIAKPFLIFGTIIFGVFLLLLLSSNLILQLPGIKDQIRATLTSALGTPISFESISLSPSFGIHLGGIRTTASEQLPAASADSLTVHPSWSALLHGDLIAKCIALDHPSITLKLAPSTKTAPSSSSSSLPSTPFMPTAVPSQSSPSLPAQGEPAEKKPSSSADTAHLLTALSIRHGQLSVLDGSSRPVLLLKDLQAQEHQGILKIGAGSAIVSDSLILHDISAEADVEGAFLSLKNITATMGDGRVTGIFRCGFPPESPDYNGTLQLTGASLRKLLADASLGSSNAEGQVDGDLTLAGKAGNGATMTGNGSLRCKEAFIEPVAFLKQIGQLLNVDELKLLKLAEGRCLFRVDQGHVVIDELFFRSENLILSAKGPLQPSGELNLESRLLFNEKLSGRLHGLLGSQLTPAPEPGYSQVTFHVSGPATNPRTDLIERLTGIHLGGNLGGLGGLLQGLFGKPAPQAPAPQPQQQLPAPQPSH